ncbi:MAG: molybdopterin dinucleotide binding domain-containing protein, partial [Clostridiales bacterium]
KFGLDEDELNDWVLADTPYTAEELRQHPEGIIYAPFTYEKWRNAPISTPSGKIEFRADYLIDMDRDPLPDYIPPVNEELEDSNEFPLIMTTGARRLLFFHGRYHNIKRFDEAVPTTGLEIHPNDAAKLGIVNGEEIEVSSRLGSIKVLADVVPANGIKEGVVHMSHGWKQYNINFITFDDRQDPYSGFPVMKSVPVKISKIK